MTDNKLLVIGYSMNPKSEIRYMDIRIIRNPKSEIRNDQYSITPIKQP
jgi:hypothetical protein